MPDTKIQDLPALTAAALADVLPIVNLPGSSPTDRSIKVSDLRAAMVSSVAVAFTDSDTFRRVTVADTLVTATSNILVSIQRADTASDSADLGHMYFANVVNRTAGTSFEVDIVCLDWGLSDATESPPNETIRLCYLIGA